MALTRSFKETVASRVRDDPAFARALLDEAIQLFIDGEHVEPFECGELFGQPIESAELLKRTQQLLA